MNTFGKVRSINNRQEDFGYFMASGTQTALEKAREELVDANLLLDDVQSTLGAIDKDIAISKEKSRVAGENWHKCKSTHCGTWNSASKCASCRNPQNAIISEQKTTIAELVADRSVAVADVNDVKATIKNISDTIDGLVLAINQEAIAETSLAEQGLTSEAIKLKAKADADAIIQNNKNKVDIAERRSKSRKFIIVGIITTAVFLTALFVYYKIKKNKMN